MCRHLLQCLALSLTHSTSSACMVWLWRDRSLDDCPRPDLMEQLSAHMNELKNWLRDILLVVPLPKGSQSKVKGSSSCYSHKQCRETPSLPPKRRKRQRVNRGLAVGSALPARGSVSLTVFVPLALATPSKLAGSPVIRGVAHLMTPP